MFLADLLSFFGSFIPAVSLGVLVTRAIPFVTAAIAIHAMAAVT